MKEDNAVYAIDFFFGDICTKIFFQNEDHQFVSIVYQISKILLLLRKFLIKQMIMDEIGFYKFIKFGKT
jgi:hypothetical protein